MTVTIRRAARDDLPEIIRMIRDFAEFERLQEYLQVTEEKLARSMFAPGAFVDGLIAEDEHRRAIGYAIFYPNFATFSGQIGMYLEDLYVDRESRGRGAGKTLLREVARLAARRGCERIDFQVLDWNETAISFYKKLGAVASRGETHFKFSGDAFRRLVN